MTIEDTAALVQFINDSEGTQFFYEAGDDIVLDNETGEEIPITRFAEQYGMGEIHF
jgi:hypothetical protein